MRAPLRSPRDAPCEWVTKLAAICGTGRGVADQLSSAIPAGCGPGDPNAEFCAALRTMILTGRSVAQARLRVFSTDNGDLRKTGALRASPRCSTVSQARGKPWRQRQGRTHYTLRCLDALHAARRLRSRPTEQASVRQCVETRRAQAVAFDLGRAIKMVNVGQVRCRNSLAGTVQSRCVVSKHGPKCGLACL